MYPIYVSSVNNRITVRGFRSMGRVISVGVWLMDLGLGSMLLIIMYTMISIRLLLMMLGGRLCLYNLGPVARRI